MACKATSSALGIDHFVRLCHDEEMFIIQQASEIVNLFNQIRLERDFSRDTVAQLEWRKIPSFPSSEKEWSPSDSLDNEVAACWQGKEGVLELRYDTKRNFEAYVKKEGNASLRIPSENIYIQWGKEPGNLTPHLSTDKRGLCLYIFDSTEVDKEKIFCDKQEVVLWEGKNLDSSIKALQVYVQNHRQRHTYSSDSAQKLEECRNAVCHIISPDKPGTGFVIGNRLLMTNHHILQSEEICQKSMAEFFYSSGKERVRVEFAPSTFFVTSKSPDTAGIAPLTKDELDFTIVALKPHPKLDNVFAHPISLNDREAAQTGKEFHLIHHPSGKSQEVLVAMDSKNRVLTVKNLSLIHEAPTDPGSSGSPLISTAMRIMALHRQALGVNPEQKAAVKVESIVSHLKNHVDPHTNESYWARILKEFVPLEKPSEIFLHFNTLLQKVVSVKLPHPYFVGREKLLEDIDHWLHEAPHLMLYGRPGIGKTEAAIAYANIHLDDYSLIWTVPSESQKQRISAYRNIASALNIYLDPTLSSDEIVQKINFHLEQNQGKPYLLIYDDLNEPFPLPQRGGCCIVTAYKKGDQTLISSKEVRCFSDEDAVKLVELITQFKRSPSMDTLIKTYENYPLLLGRVAIHISRLPGMTIEQYLIDYKFEGVFDLSPGNRYEKEIEQAITRTLDVLAPKAVAWLQACAYLSPASISLSYLEEWVRIAYPEDFVHHCQIKDDILVAITEQALQQFDEPSKRFSFHRLFHQAMQKYKTQALFQQVEALLLSMAQKWNFRTAKNWKQCLQAASEWEAHILLWKTTPFFTEISEENKGIIESKLGELKYAIANYQEALKHHTNSLEIRKSVLGVHDPSVASSLDSIGRCHEAQGEYSSAFDHYEQALKAWQKSLGPGHLDVAIALNHIGGFYYAKSEYEKALEYYQKALEIRKKELDPNHSDVAMSLNNISAIYHVQGHYEKALEYYIPALKAWQESLGPSHPEVVACLNNIGGCYYDQGDYKKAFEYITQTIEIQKNTFMHDHPDMAYSLNSMGKCYYAQREYTMALEYYKEALEIRRKVLGPHHSDVAISLSDIGDCYCEQGDYNLAFENYNQAFGIWQEIDPNHSEAAAPLNGIGRCYYGKKDYKQALEQHAQALEIQKKSLGFYHPDVASSLNNMGNCYNSQGNYEKAIESFSQAEKIAIASLGVEHAMTKKYREAYQEVLLLQITVV